MKLEDFIAYLRDPQKLDQYLKRHNIDTDSEQLEIYMQDALSVDSEVKVFPIELTGDKPEFQHEGIDYVQLFPMSLALDAFDFLQLSGKSNTEAAKRLLHYRHYDA